MRYALLMVFQVSCFIAGAQQWKPVANGNKISFRIKNFGVNVEGMFTSLDGIIRFDPDNPLNSQFQVTVETASLTSGIELRDKHLRKPEYLDVGTYPQIKFTSQKITAGSEKDTWILTGLLTIKKVTKEISFPFKAIPKKNNYMLMGEFKINRRDFDVGGSSFSMADTLNVSIAVEVEKTNSH
jgi:polyisoprenoid-binding protein YceI